MKTVIAACSICRRPVRVLRKERRREVQCSECWFNYVLPTLEPPFSKKRKTKP